MDIKNYQQKPEKPLTFEEWKGDRAPMYSDEAMKSLERLHQFKYQEEFDKMLREEYNEYLSNINGNWLLNG